jgi:hypothetical protein
VDPRFGGVVEVIHSVGASIEMLDGLFGISLHFVVWLLSSGTSIDSDSTDSLEGEDFATQGTFVGMDHESNTSSFTRSSSLSGVSG